MQCHLHTRNQVHNNSHFTSPPQEVQNTQEVPVFLSALDTSSNTLFTATFSAGKAGGEMPPGGRWNYTIPSMGCLRHHLMTKPCSSVAFPI